MTVIYWVGGIVSILAVFIVGGSHLTVIPSIECIGKAGGIVF